MIELMSVSKRRPGARTTLVALAAAMFFWGGPAAAVDPLLGVRVAEQIAAGNREAAIGLLTGALASETDPRAVRDLLERKGELERDAGLHAEAADTQGRLADRIAKEEGALSPDLVPALATLSADLVAAGRFAPAVDALEEALRIARSAGLSGAVEPLLGRLEEIAERAGDPVLAQRARGVAAGHVETARRLAEETGRGFEVDPDKGFSTVRIYYATDRARSGDELPNTFYGGGRGTLEMGTALVSIPERHRPGRIEAPSIWTFDFREDPERHIVLSSVTPQADEAVFAQMQDHIRETGSAEAFVFVHGFNVPFHEAAKRTAQMAFDMNFDGLPILYSWPSRASLMSYIADTAVVNLSGRRLSGFLDELVARSGAKRIHLIGHSMGNRALTDALELFALRHAGEKPAFDQVLFTAPDLDAGLFAEMMATIRPAAERITLYASNKDWALAVSRQLHGDSPRAGQGGRQIVHVADVDSIDMTEIGDDMLKHSYYANNPSALTDILSLFWRDAPPEKRCGMTRTEGEYGSYWVYAPEACDSDALLSTLSFLRRGSFSTVDDARRFMNRFIVPTSIDPTERLRLEGVLGKLFGN